MKNYPAQLQDGFYSVGRALVRSEEASIENEELPVFIEEYVIEEIAVIEPEIFVDPEAAQLEPEIVQVLWYKRLWSIMNMDVRDVWKLIRERWKRAEISR